MRTFAAGLAAMVLASWSTACGNVGGAPDAVVKQTRPVTTSVAASGADVPETLSAATAAAQADADRFSSGDFAGVWAHMSHQVRDGISQDDFTSLYRACKTPGAKIRVAGVSLDAHDTAIVRMRIRGADRTRTMVYENGDWAMEPTHDFASHLGEPVGQIVAEERAAGLCTR